MDDVAKLAAGLSEAQRRALCGCTPWDVDCLPAGVAARFCELRFLQATTILDGDEVELTPLGQAVRSHLLKG